MDIVKRTVSDIKSLKIQGASQVQKFAVTALAKSVLGSKAKSEAAFRKEFLANAEALFHARPTEPELRTALTILKKSISENGLEVNEMKSIISKTAANYELDRERALNEIAVFGAKLIPKGSTILTHCHSHSVINTIIHAKKKINRVFCCEARPLFQGRLSAADLSGAGIDTTLIVDSAVASVIKKCDYFLTGADAVLADGDVINKIGTNTISTVCKNFEVPHYVFASTHKFEPSTFFGKTEPIEERSPDEVWDKKSRKKVRVFNPAFDRTDSRLIEGIICELGVFAPQQLTQLLYKRLDLDKYHKDFLRL